MLPDQRILELIHTPGYKPLMALLEKKIEEQLDQVTVNQLFDQQSVGKHNVAIGKIQAFKEIVNVLQAPG